MKRASFAILAFLSLSFLVSCESTNSRRAGGGAFDNSELGRKLDANAHLEDPEIPGERSFEQWRDND
ncbi:hypothetical protein V2O64_23265 [Verrucomicrobiaceae bacterium 227]